MSKFEAWLLSLPIGKVVHQWELRQVRFTADMEVLRIPVRKPESRLQWIAQPSSLLDCAYTVVEFERVPSTGYMRRTQ